MMQPAAHPCDHNSGFTLVELMVVITIMALAAGLIVLSLPGDSDAVRDDANRLAAHISAVRDGAVTGGQPLAIAITRSGYVIERRDERGWQPVNNGAFRAVEWRSGIMAKLPQEGDLPRLVFDNTGLPQAAGEITLVKDGVEATLLVDALGEIRLER